MSIGSKDDLVMYGLYNFLWGSNSSPARLFGRCVFVAICDGYFCEIRMANCGVAGLFTTSIVARLLVFVVVGEVFYPKLGFEGEAISPYAWLARRRNIVTTCVLLKC